MIPNHINAMRPYGASNINLGKDLLYLSFVLGVDFFQLVSGNDIKSFGASFNHNVTDSYNYFDVYINWKFTPYKGLSLGTELSFVIGSDFITVMWGLVADYNYFITKDFFVNVKIESGINFFNQNSSNLGENLYFIGGVFVGWNGF